MPMGSNELFVICGIAFIFVFVIIRARIIHAT